MSDSAKIGAQLVAAGVISRQGLEVALVEQLQKGAGRLCSLLAGRGVPEADLLRVLTRQRGAPGVALSATTLDLAALQLVPQVICERHLVLPIDVDDNTLTLAVTDPDDAQLLSQIAFASGRHVQPLLALQGRVQQLIPRAFSALRQGGRYLRGGDPEHFSTDGVVTLEIIRPDDEWSALPEDEELTLDEPGWDAELVTVAQSPTVLVVEDDDGIRDLLARVLQIDGYDVIEARTGTEALRRLRQQTPRLILLDAMLPEVHGFEICQQVKRSPALQHVPVVMISAVYRGFENAREIQEAHGADRFLEKPFDVHYLRQVVADVLGSTLEPPPPDPRFARELEETRDVARGAYEQKRFDEALALAGRWSELSPFDPLPWLLLGNVRHAQGDLPAALAAFERAATFGPELFAAQKNLALLYEKLGFTKKAFERWRRSRQSAEDEATRQRIDLRLKTRYAAFL